MSVRRYTKQPSRLSRPGRQEEAIVERCPLPLDLERWCPGSRPWELEIGFGKGRYLLARAEAEPEGRFLGIELVSRYFHLAGRRAGRRGLDNVLLLRGEALYLLSACLPERFAAAVHVYFPDPWHKSRHHKRRLFDPETVDLVLGPLVVGGKIYFASDHLAYAEEVEALLDSHPALSLERRSGWPEGPRTNYEAKYVREGRPILRLEATLEDPRSLLHPAGRESVLVAPRAAEEESESPSDGG